MPNPKGVKSVPIRAYLVQKLSVKWEEQKSINPDTNKDLGGFVNDLLDLVLRKEAFMKEYSPYLSLRSYSGNTLFIKDTKIDVTVEIYRHDDKIKCVYHDSFDCDHIHFALGLPEIAKLNLKQPKG